MGTSAGLAASAPRIFVSYNRQDIAFTQRLVETLEALGVFVWVDWEGARDGDFLKRINQGLVRRDWLVLVETPHSLASNPVEMEVHAALNRVLYGQMRGVVRLVAATRDPRSVPPTWATLQYYDATSDYDTAVSAMLAAIRAGDQRELQREAHRPGGEHPGGHSIAALAPVAAPTSDAEHLLNLMISVAAEPDWQRVEDIAYLLTLDHAGELKDRPDEQAHPRQWVTDYYRLRGRALLELARPGEAATALKVAYARDKSDLPTMRAAARAALQAQDPASAEEPLQRAVTLEGDPDERLDILREYVPALVSLNKPAEALRRVEQALGLRKDDPAWLAQRRDLLATLGSKEQALGVARALANRPEAAAADWLALARLARLAGQAGAAEESVQALLRAQALDAAAPGLADERDALLAPLTAQREREQQASQWAEALRTLASELRLAPDDRGRQITRADLLHRAGRNGEARDTLNALIAGRYGAVADIDEALRLAQVCADLGYAEAGWRTLTQTGLLASAPAGAQAPGAQAGAASRATALTLATRLVRMPGAPFAAWLSVARLLVAAGRPRDAWNLLSEPIVAPAELTQLVHARAELFPPPDVPQRLASLGLRGVNMGAPAIIPPLVSVAAGRFLMGSDKRSDPQTYDQEMPQGWVEVAAFQLGKYPVTVAEYALAVRAQAVPEPPASGKVTWQTQLQRLDHPVVCVSWQDAMAYVTWLREATNEPGWRLPTEAEWEKAARWDPRANASRLYPWGDSFDQNRCNTSESKIGATTPVGSYPASDARRSGASPCGAEEMAGNVWEWMSSLYKPYPYTLTDGREAQDSTENRVLRGGSWVSDARDERAAYRSLNRPGIRNGGCGFRLALSRVPAGAAGDISAPITQSASIASPSGG